ncbi:uridine 5'-monophosphate synthase isoform X2 [Octopus sinensis]|uniref:Orotidine 5'-phosphate decarboxylase n=1 Tax=Octopus sinensis TaxID=2607531 RepID=A0A6P7SDN4_9MOLL|nr:uridine 5'-monophosphate synthase isoform X2 [Octopus sinensis]
MELIVKLFDIGCVKFGNFTLKSGIEAPIYFDFRILVSFPQLMCIAVNHNVPMLVKRKEAKDYGTKKMVEGNFQQNDKCLIIEDVVTSGSSIIETALSLRSLGICVTDAIVLLNREQGCEINLKQHNLNIHSLFTLKQFLEILSENNKISTETVLNVSQFITMNQTGHNFLKLKDEETEAKLPRISQQTLNFQQRAELCSHPVAKRLFTIMAKKQTNLILSVDFTSCAKILEIVEKIAPYICAVKTHIDIVLDFNMNFISQLVKLSEEFNFILFEDRKFSDIGSTVFHQYTGGVYLISSWAHLVNAHSVPGDGVIKGLKKSGMTDSRACVLIAEMSSAGNLAEGEYTRSTIKMAEEHSDFVIGFICQKKLLSDPKFIHMTPGVKMSAGKDDLGQQYLTPEKAICVHGSDAIIVGRGIIEDPDPVAAAKNFQAAAYAAYETQVE